MWSIWLPLVAKMVLRKRTSYLYLFDKLELMAAKKALICPSYLLAPHPCLEVCSHLCLLKPGGFKCACPDDPNVICKESIHVQG